MAVLTERNLQITIEGALDVRKFDDSYQMRHCMKAVDFIVELSDRYLFIELKDPQHPYAPIQVAADYARRFRSEEFDEDLKYKYRDSFLYEWATGRADKPVDYLVLIALDVLSGGDLLDGQERLERKLPLRVPGQVSWPRPIVTSCAVFNIETWNRFLPQYPVTRLP